MEEKFIDGDLLPPEKLRALRVRTDAHSVRRLVAQCSWLLLSFLLVLVAPAGPWRWVALLVHGTAHFGFFGLLHEISHGTAFAPGRLNGLAGWIAGFSHFMSPAMMRCFHFEHHRHTHELDRDPELMGFRFMARWPGPLLSLLLMTGMQMLVARVGWLFFAALIPPSRPWQRILPFVGERDRPRVIAEARLLLGAHAILLALALSVLPQLRFYYLGILVGHSILAIYTMCEHRGLTAEGTVLERTRSIETTAWIRWLLWNMPYHAEHHAWPAIPWYALPELHREVRGHLPHRGLGILALHRRRGRDLDS